MTRETIDKLAKTLAETLPDGLRSVGDDIERNFRAVLQSGIDKLDLVTRDEFEVQQAVLARTRQKLEALEARLGSLEAPPARKPATKKKVGRKKAAAKKKASTRKKRAAKKTTR
jgi:BMFP domain-containing protein YqiC